MRSGMLFGVCVALVVMCVYLPEPCEAGWKHLGKLTRLGKNGSVDFMDHRCNYQFKPRIRKRQFIYDCKFWCPDWAPYAGWAKSDSMTGSLQEATKEFVNKATQKGLISEQDAEIWLKG